MAKNPTPSPKTFLDVAEMSRGRFMIFRVACEGSVWTPGEIVKHVGAFSSKRIALREARSEAARTGETITCAGKVVS